MIEKTYQPSEIEGRIYAAWEKRRRFVPVGPVVATRNRSRLSSRRRT
jgi:hypothetical protein